MITLKLTAPPGMFESDSDVIAECQAGNIEAFGILVARHRDGIYNFIRHAIGHEADAQDLAQEAFVRAFGALSRFRLGSPFEPWIYTIAANLCRSHLRTKQRRPQANLAAEEFENLHVVGDDPALLTENAEENRRLLLAIYNLPLEQRMVIVLRHMRSYSYQRISSILDLPVSTVEHRLRAAREVLRRQLNEEAVVDRRGGERS